MLTTEQQVLEQIKKAKNILITFKKVWDGDAVASALAFLIILKKMGKNAEVVAERFDQSANYGFLPGFKSIKYSLDGLRKFIISLDISKTKVGQIKYKIEDQRLNFIIAPKEGFFTGDDVKTDSGEFKYDLIITLDTPDLESLGSVYDNDTDFFYQVPLVNIDHHPHNEAYGQINLVELTAISSSEILFNLFTGVSRDLIDEDVATCLLAGIIAKTKSYKTQNITPQALSASSQLIAMGARREEIINHFYRSRPLATLKLWGRVLARLKSDLDHKLVWSVLTRADFEKTGTTAKDIFEVVDELIVNIPQAKIIVLLYESGNGAKKTEALAYSTTALDSLDLLKAYQPQGGKQLAKIEVNQPIGAAENEIIETIRARLAKLPL